MHAHCLSISCRSKVVVSGIVRKVITRATNDEHPDIMKNSPSLTKLNRIDAISAPSFPADADMP